MLLSPAPSYRMALPPIAHLSKSAFQYNFANERPPVEYRWKTGSDELLRFGQREDIQCTSQTAIAKDDNCCDRKEEKVKGYGTIETVLTLPSASNLAAVNVHHAVTTVAGEEMAERYSENGVRVKEALLPKRLPTAPERAVAAQSRTIIPETHVVIPIPSCNEDSSSLASQQETDFRSCAERLVFGKYITGGRDPKFNIWTGSSVRQTNIAESGVFGGFPGSRQTAQDVDRDSQIEPATGSTVKQKEPDGKEDRVDNRPFDTAFIPPVDEVEVFSQRLSRGPTPSTETEDPSRATLTNQEVLPETNYFELSQGLDDKYGLAEFASSLTAPLTSSIGRLGISPTPLLGYHSVSFVGAPDIPKPVYPLPVVPPQPLEALNPLTSKDRVAAHKESSQLEDVEASEESLHGPLNFRIPKTSLREIQQASLKGKKTFWQHTLYQRPDGKRIEVHYCQSKDASERIAQLFLDQDVVGFDIEWKMHATANEGVRKNVALVQLASEERIALFHIARYPAGDAPEDLVAPSLQKIMESPNITKAGVAIKADCTRLRRYMRIDSRGLLELSHLYKLVKFSAGDVKQINKRLVTLAQQVEEHLKLPLWKGEVRISDWTEQLNYQQIECAVIPSESDAVLILNRCGIRFIRWLTGFLRLGRETKSAFSNPSSAMSRRTQPPHSARK